MKLAGAEATILLQTAKPHDTLWADNFTVIAMSHEIILYFVTTANAKHPYKHINQFAYDSNTILLLKNECLKRFTSFLLGKK